MTWRPWKLRTAAATLAGGLTLSFEDTFRPREPVPVVTEDRRREPTGVVLYFHPEVPEATMVLLPGPG